MEANRHAMARIGAAMAEAAAREARERSYVPVYIGDGITWKVPKPLYRDLVNRRRRQAIR